MKYNVSVVVLTYNAVWEKLRRTLDSIVVQRGLEFEIIVADDGSSVRSDDRITVFFAEKGFTAYKLVNAKENCGTVKNLFNGVSKAEGEYIKPIAAGDFIYGPDSLCGWFKAMKANNAKISFGDAVYYQEADSDLKIVREVNSPMQLSYYDGNCSRRKFFVNYLLANDTVLGAALMTEHNVMKHYLGEIKGKVKFAEDYMVRLAVFDGVKIYHYPENVIWYEYGTGVSAGTNDKWKNMLLADFRATNAILAARTKYPDYCAALFSKVMRLKGKAQKLAKGVCFPDYQLARKKNQKAPAHTPENAVIKLLQMIVKGTKDASSNS
ncbi:MAG: glycosyltransferase [Ruminococcus sp.]|nr:glycosyltransferase [Ruminococcus sp.]